MFSYILKTIQFYLLMLIYLFVVVANLIWIAGVIYVVGMLGWMMIRANFE
jgi:hypothetical protein